MTNCLDLHKSIEEFYKIIELELTTCEFVLKASDESLFLLLTECEMNTYIILGDALHRSYIKVLVRLKYLIKKRKYKFWTKELFYRTLSCYRNCYTSKETFLFCIEWLLEEQNI